MVINWHAFKEHKEAMPLLIFDIAMLALISLSLLWLLIDSLLINTGIGILLSQQAPHLVLAYEKNWHPHLKLYDTLFTLFLLFELVIRWGWAIYKQTYHRWFFYPFVHWYDVLACLPNLQFLRLLRLVSVFYRLHKLGILLIGTRLVRFAKKYYSIVLEEISDRIVLNVLDGIQKELKTNNPVASELREKVLNPQKTIITQWFANRIGHFVDISYQKHEQELAIYLNQLTYHAISHNQEWQQLKRRLPFVGGLIEQELNAVVSSLVNDMAQTILKDLSHKDNAALHDLANAAFDTFTLSDEQLDVAIEKIAIDAIEIIKKQVAVQQWKLDEENEKK